MPFSEKQREVLRFPYNKAGHQTLICDGSIRAGKSIAMLISYITWAMNQFDRQRFGLCAKTVKTAERNIIKPLTDIQYFHTEFNLTWNKGDSLVTVTRGGTKNYFYIFGGKDESSYQLVQGITLAGAFFDEVALMPESFVNTVTGRCSVEGALFWFNCNPEDPNHWFYTSWIKQAEKKNALYLHFEMDDNPSLTKETIKRYESIYEGTFYRRFIKGEWVRAEGIIYRKFADKPENYILNELPTKTTRSGEQVSALTFIQVGVDFGGTDSGTSFVAVGFVGFEYIIILESERYVGEYDPDDIDNMYSDFCKLVRDKYGKAFVTRADSAEQVLIRGLRNIALRNDLHTDIRNAQKKEILDRIKLFLKLIGQKRIYFMRQAQTAIKAFSNAVWDDKHPDVRLDNGSTDIDTIDATEYAVEEFTESLLAAKPVDNNTAKGV